ncbi:carboxysome shell protein [Thiosulfatimonas sediminis]|uniref:Carboxysome shell carbonic anhydrase n=1 Tax=Thiosulfatimonas sediminis TaxID=2675054 RepID=A0A6F8PYJ6_9GAMM|nr:carboxysome shell carbonic anhydrase [Thiosulfatimonas sediminis]BBP47068.1 carboxysome shell protein [Thiosulfatimonas sediminis]
MLARGRERQNRSRPALPRPIPYKRKVLAAGQFTTIGQSHPLVDQLVNERLRAYELASKARFDNIAVVLEKLAEGYGRRDFISWANKTLQAELGFELPLDVLQQASIGGLNLRTLYSQCVFEQFLAFSQVFFDQDPLQGQATAPTAKQLHALGYHAVGIAPCADGRLAHIVSYILRLPYDLVRRKAHAGALFDVSESVRNWVFIEHMRFREAKPNAASEPTRYLKIASYHFSKADPQHQGCAAHSSDDAQAAQAALDKLIDFRQAIENRFGCGSTIDVVLLGVNTDDDSLRVHVPDEHGQVQLERYVETQTLYHQTLNLNAETAKKQIKQSLVVGNRRARQDDKDANLRNLLAWLIERNMAQIDYVHRFESGCYKDLGHAERFIGIGSGFEEVQLRNLTYYSFLETFEEGLADVQVGIKIFKKLNLCHGRPIPVIIRVDFDGRVAESRNRAIKKARRIEKAVHEQFSELSKTGMLHTLCTLRDHNAHAAAIKLTSEI